MTELNSFREKMIQKSKQAGGKMLAFKAAFEKKAKAARADLEEARSIWNETAKKFKWWNSLP
jgi:hypothetical protein